MYPNASSNPNKMRNKQFVEGRKSNYYIVKHELGNQNFRSRSAMHSSMRNRYPIYETPKRNRTSSQSMRCNEIWKPKTNTRFTEVLINNKKQNTDKLIEVINTLSEEEINNVLDYIKFMKEDTNKEAFEKSESHSTSSEVSNMYFNANSRSMYVKRLEQKLRKEKEERMKLLQKLIHLSNEVKNIRSFKKH